MNKHIFPLVMICLNLGQAIVMLSRKDMVSMMYWLAAATLNVTVMMKQ